MNPNSIPFPSNAYIFEYVHGSKNAPVGVVAALKTPTGVWVGHSRANKHAGDKFDRERGLTIALNRAAKGSAEPIPHSLIDRVLRMKERAVRYFNDETVSIAGVFNN